VQHAESSLQAQQRLDGQSDEQTEMKRIRQLRRARSELYHLRAAVACQAHALSRLLEVVYGVRGRQKWRALHVRRICSLQLVRACYSIRSRTTRCSERRVYSGLSCVADSPSQSPRHTPKVNRPLLRPIHLSLRLCCPS
jgi:hypothetical protein